MELLHHWLTPHILSIIGFAFALALLARLNGENTPPSSTIAWLLAIFLIPYIGVPLYLVFGGRKIKQAKKKKNLLYPVSQHNLPQRNFLNDTERILIACQMPPATLQNHTQILPKAQNAYNALMNTISQAQKFIHVTTFVLGTDPVAQNILSLLAQKAKQGVEVRLLIDALGSWKARGSFLKPLYNNGGEVGIFMPVLPLYRKWAANLRNHRKLVVVDGHTTWLGGMNLSGDYLGPTPSKWDDISILVHGPAAVDVNEIFLSDWEFATGIHLDEEQYLQYPTTNNNTQYPNTHPNVALQVVASGPDVPTEPLYDAILASIYQAKQRVWIVSPYFVPDEILARSLCLLAQLGVDVKIIVPSQSDQLLADLARNFYARQLHKNGAKLFGYQPKLLHSKIVVIDDHTAIIGSANMDIRSLYLNYEISLFIYSTPQVEEIAQKIKNFYLAQSKPWQPPSPGIKNWLWGWAEDIAHLMAPLL